MSQLDFVLGLADPAAWLNGVISNFVVRGFDPETCTIRHGTTGTGAFPNYKIEEPSRMVTLPIEDGLMFDFPVTPGCTFNGRHHLEMSELNDLARHDEHWSAVMTLQDAKDARWLLSRAHTHSRAMH